MQWIRSLQIECFAIEHVQWICSFLGPLEELLCRVPIDAQFPCCHTKHSVSCPADSRYGSIDFIHFILALAVKMQETADIGCSLGSSQLAFHFDEFFFHLYTIQNIYIYICFPEMGVPANHPFNRSFHYRPIILGYPPIYGNPPYVYPYM